MVDRMPSVYKPDLDGEKRKQRVRKSWRNIRGQIIPLFFVITGSGFVIIPLIWIVLTAVKPADQIIHMPVIYIPDRFTFENFQATWTTGPLFKWYFNTIVVSVFSTIIGITLSALAGYGFSRHKIKGKMTLLISILLSQMFPQILIVIPYFVWMSQLNLVDTYLSLILAYLGGILPFSIWTLKGFTDTIPYELDQAAKIDGCGEIATFVKIIFPLTAPGVAAATLFAFLTAWNNYLLTCILVTKTDMLTLNVGVTKFISEFGIQWGPLNAVVVMTALPLILAFTFFEKYMVAGLTSGAVKG